MRILVDVSEAQVSALESLSRRTHRSRASLIRAAMDDFLARHHRDQVADGFGLWGQGELDGLAYQEKARGEW